MALKDYVFDLSDVVAAGTTGIISVKSGSEIVATVDAGAAGLSTGPVVIDGFGTLTYNSTRQAVTFKADAGLPEGSYSVSLQGTSSHVSLDAFNASKASKGITLIADQDAEFVGTAGGDTVNITVDNATVKGGSGADTFIFSDVKSSVEDYKYADGDVVSLGAKDVADAGLSRAGLLTAGNASVKVAENSSGGLFYVDLKDQSGAEALLATASGFKTDVSVTLSDKAGVVDVSAADTAVIDLGQKNDTITATNTALTLKVGRADGDNVLMTSLDADDTLALLNGDLSLVSVNGTNGNLTFGETTIQKAVDTTNQSTFKVSFDDGKTTGIAAAGTNQIDVEADKLPDFYVGIGTGTKVNVKSTTTDVVVIDLSDDSKISGKVNYIDATNATGNATLKGRAEEATTIKAGNVLAGKTQEIYTGTGADSVALVSNATGAFKVHLSNAEGNADTVSGFRLANDVLVLDDVAKLAVDTFSVNSSDLLLKTSQASVGGAVVAGKDVQIQLSGADKAIKVALAQDVNKIITAHKDTDVVLNVNDTVPAGVTYANATFGEAFTVDLNDTNKYIGTFVSVNASNAGQAALVLGKDGVDNHVTVDGGSVVWGGNNSNDSIRISTVDVNGGSIVWTGAAGGKDTLVGYNGTKDVIYSYDRAAWTNEAIKSDVTFDGTGNVIINSADGSTLNIGTNAGGNLLLMGNQMEVSKVAIASAGVATYASDVNVYLSAAANATVKVDNSAVAEGSNAVIDLSANNLMGEGKTYGDNITVIDAHESAGNFLLVGANVSGSKITGGQTMNVLYGGGNADQTMTGVDAAADLFWFGSTDGHDTIKKFDANRDVVYLWSTTNIDDVTVSSISIGAATVVFEATGSTLDISGTDIANTTFMVRDGADGYNYYTYDAENKAFVKKQ